MLDPSGSSSNITHSLCNALSERNCSVTLITGPHWERTSGLSGERNYDAKVWFYKHTQKRSYDSIGIRKIFWRALRFFGHLLIMFRILFVVPHYDLIHIQWLTVPSVDILWLWTVTRFRPVVYTVHNLYPHTYKSRLGANLVYGQIYRLSTRLLVHSDRLKENIISEFRIEAEKIFQVPHGNLAHVSDLEHSPLKNDHPALQGPTILFFGQIRENKGLDTLLKATAQVVKEMPTARLLVAGVPAVNMRPYYELARELGIYDSIEFRLGYVEENEIPSYFRYVSVVALPYKTIGQSGVAVAASTFGKAVVATRCGGLEELVQEAGNGILVEVGDSEGMASAIVRIIQDEDLRKTYEANSKRYAERNLSWEVVAEKTIRVYKGVLASNDIGEG